MDPDVAELMALFRKGWEERERREVTTPYGDHEVWRYRGDRTWTVSRLDGPDAGEWTLPFYTVEDAVRATHLARGGRIVVPLAWFGDGDGGYVREDVDARLAYSHDRGHWELHDWDGRSWDLGAEVVGVENRFVAADLLVDRLSPEPKPAGAPRRYPLDRPHAVGTVDQVLTVFSGFRPALRG